MNPLQLDKVQSSTTSTPISTDDKIGSLQGRSAELGDEESQQKMIADIYRKSLLETGLKRTFELNEPLANSVAEQVVEKSLNEMEEEIKAKLELWKNDFTKHSQRIEGVFKILREEVSPLAIQLETQHKIGKQLQRELALIEKVLDRPKKIVSQGQLIECVQSKDLGSTYVKPAKFEVKRCWIEEEILLVTVAYECAKNSPLPFIAHWHKQYEELDFSTVHINLLTNEQNLLPTDEMEMVEETFYIDIADGLRKKLITPEEAKNVELLAVKHLLAKVVIS